MSDRQQKDAFIEYEAWFERNKVVLLHYSKDSDRVISLKNVYQHIKEFSAFSFKQNYDEVFTSSKLYYVLDKSTWNHSKKIIDASENYYDKYSVSLLKKDLSASYK